MRKFVLILAMMMLLGSQAEAKTTYRYTTQKVKMSKELTAKHNTKVKILKTGKKCSLVEYHGKQYSVKKKCLNSKKAVNKYKGRSFKRVGHARWGGYSWTWYTTKRYPDRRNALGIKDKHVDKRGFILDKDGYICLASGRGNKKKHAIVPTPFGRYGKVYDTNGGYNNRWFDVYTNW